MNGYTSDLLCHFVGRSKKTDDDRFNLLIAIIQGQTLLANVSEPDNLHSSTSSNYHCQNVGEVYEQCDCVCFCDIPDQALSIHTSKYSRFGMGFNKAFIAQQGAHPVMYIPSNYPIVERGNSEKARSDTPKEPTDYFPYLLMLSCNLLPLLSMSADISKLTSYAGYLDMFNNDVKNKFLACQYHPMIYSLIQGIGTQMAYVKLFDATLPNDHPDNYYMEREWRSINNVSFTLEDIVCIYLPSIEYKNKFQEFFPEYNGKYYLFE